MTRYEAGRRRAGGRRRSGGTRRCGGLAGGRLAEIRLEEAKKLAGQS